MCFLRLSMDVQVDGIETHTHTASPTQTVYIQTACHQLMAILDKTWLWQKCHLTFFIKNWTWISIHICIKFNPELIFLWCEVSCTTYVNMNRCTIALRWLFSTEMSLLRKLHYWLHSDVKINFTFQLIFDHPHCKIWRTFRPDDIPRVSVCFKDLWASYQICNIEGCACAGNAGNVFPATDFKWNRKLTIPACITARASRTCRDVCRDR